MDQRSVRIDESMWGSTNRHLDELRVFLFESVIGGLNEIHRVFSQSLLQLICIRAVHLCGANTTCGAASCTEVQIVKKAALVLIERLIVVKLRGTDIIDITVKRAHSISIQSIPVLGKVVADLS